MIKVRQLHPRRNVVGAFLLPDTWTNNLDGLWTENVDMQTDADAETVPIRYEDALRQYLEKDPTLSAGDIPSIADLNVDYATDIEVIPKTKEQLISELAPKIQKTGVTPGRAAIAAQEMYAKAEERFGSDMDAVLESYQPGQNPRKFLDGFQNAYLSGKLGDKAALENSTAAAYLTEEQRGIAFDLGYKKSGRLQLDYANDNGIIAAGSVLDHFDRKIRLSDISEDLKKVNPNYSSREYKWRNNCQRCVATYEMRRRGYNVTAKPILVDVEKDVVAKNWSKVWTQDPPLLCRSGSGKAQVEAQMKRWGDGARAIVCVTWLVTGSSHVFVAEQQNGTTVFVDPQTGNSDCSKSFARVMNGMTQLLRVDNLTPTDLIKECCENRR